MNPLTNMKNVTKLSEQELHTSNKTSWHDQYKNSAWIFVGGFSYDLTEGDIICIFSQYGEIVNINLIRDKDTGKSKGFCFICYEDQRSTVLAVDNFNGIRVLNRILRVDHVNDYKVPKSGKKTDEETKKLYEEGCAPKAVAPPIATNPLVKDIPQDVRETLADQIQADIRLPARLPIYTVKTEPLEEVTVKTEEEKSKKPKKKKKSKQNSSDESSEESAKTKKQKKTKRKYSSNEDSDSDSEKNKRKKQVIPKQSSSSRSKYSDNNERHRSRSRSSDRKQYGKKYKRRSRSRSVDRKHYSKNYDTKTHKKK